MIFEHLIKKSPNQIHHINRYMKFISTRSMTGNTKHHILPKAIDMYPEFRCFKDHPWNLAMLTAREHFIAHKILSKVFPKSSQSRCFFYMLNKCDKKNSKTYQVLLDQHRKHLKGNTHKLGKKESLETRKRKSEAQKGRLLGNKIGLGNKSRKGQVQSLEERLKRSAALLGNQNAKGVKSSKPNLGRKWYHNPMTNEKRMLKQGEPISAGFVAGMGS
jgi:hypothetical protein